MKQSWSDYQTRYASLRDALKPVPLQPGRTYIPLKGHEVQTETLGSFWWDLPERFVDRTYYPSFHQLRYALYTFCLLVMDEDDYLYVTLRVSELDCRVVARSRTWAEAEQAHATYHQVIITNPTEFGFQPEDIKHLQVDSDSLGG